MENTIKIDDKILKDEKQTLRRATKVLKEYKDTNDLKIYNEYIILFNKYEKLLKQNQYIYKISDTYQNKLIRVKEKLKGKIKELMNTKQELETTNKKLTKISTRDQLTGLYNRREFEKIIKREWRTAIRQALPISIIMIDIDYFKKFNDNYGHLAGDNCLQKISQAMDKNLKRPRDFLARYGGEEFVAILPNTDKSGAQNIAESLRKSVISLKIPHNYSPVTKHVTISLGISSTDQAEFFVFEEILDKADEALYQAKNSGRNKYCFNQL